MKHSKIAAHLSDLCKGNVKMVRVSMRARLTKCLLGIAAMALMLPGFVHAQTALTPAATVNLVMTVGQPFSQNFIGNGTLNNGYQTVGVLPPGLSAVTAPLPPPATFNSMMTLSGTPTTAGTYVFDVNVTASNLSAGPSSYTTTFSVVVTPPAPTASPVSVTFVSNSSAGVINPIITGTATSIAVGTAPTHGIATVSGMTLNYTPTANYVGTDTLTYIATGPGGSSAPATVSITVTAAPPAVANVSGTFLANSSANTISPTITGTATSIAVGTAPTHGVVTASGLTLSYVPTANYVGTDTFTYIATGPGGPSAPGTASITVTAAPATTANFTFQANSTNNPITPLVSSTATSFAVSAAPAHGVATVNGLAISYAPAQNYVGSDTFTYTASSATGVFASSTVTISVVAAAPAASAGNLSVVSGASGSIDLAGLVSGPIFTGITITVATAPTHGTATLNGTVLTYTSAHGFVGADTLNFVAHAIGGPSQPAVLSITVTARPDPSKDLGVIAMQAAGAAAVRHFERTQLDNFNGRLSELSAGAAIKENAGKQCGGVAMWAAGLNSFGSYNNKGPNGFDYNSSGASVGGDRCFGNGSTVAGIGFGYGREHSKVGFDGSTMQATASTGAAYGSLQLLPSLRGSWLAGVNQIGSDFDRYVAINSTFAHGRWSGKQYFTSGSVSNEYTFGTFHFTPFGRLDLSKLTLDPYSETGAGIYGLHYDAQTMQSQRTTAGFISDFSTMTGFGKLTPRLRLEYQRDFARRNPVHVSYADGGDDATYVIVADELDRYVVLGSAGAELLMTNGIIVMLNYSYSTASGGNTANALQMRLSYKF